MIPLHEMRLSRADVTHKNKRTGVESVHNAAIWHVESDFASSQLGVSVWESADTKGTRTVWGIVDLSELLLQDTRKIEQEEWDGFHSSVMRDMVSVPRAGIVLALGSVVDAYQALKVKVVRTRLRISWPEGLREFLFVPTLLNLERCAEIGFSPRMYAELAALDLVIPNPPAVKGKKSN